MVRLKKEVMKVGRFQMKNGKSFDVTKDRITHWANVFNEMVQMKINVPACKDHICNAENTIGRVSEMEAVDNSLYAVFDFPRESDAEMARLNDVSIATRDNLVTGVGNFSDAIEHIAITPQPVVPGMSGYSLVCSLGDISQVESSSASQQPKRDEVAKSSGYALQRAMEIVSGIFGVAIPPEAARSEEAAITYLQTIASCKQAGMIQEMKQTQTQDAVKDIPDAGQEPPVDEQEAPVDEQEQASDEQEPTIDEQVDTQDDQEQPVDEQAPPTDEQTAPVDDEEEKKKKTPGEDGIIASLNDYRRMVIENVFQKAGLNTTKTKEAVHKFCLCETKEDYFRSVPEFEAFREGLSCSLASLQSNGGLRELLTTNMTGPQIPEQNNTERRKSIFEMRGELRK